MKRYLAPLGWGLGMLVLILDGQTAMAGAAEGVVLCLRTLIPSLFPFFVLSAMLADALPGGLLLTGLLSGYPVGAGNVARAYHAGQLTREEAERMVVLCNCAGPSFLFGVVAPVLGDARQGALLWGVYLVSVLALWTVFPKTVHTKTTPKHIPIQDAVSGAIRAMAGVCGWVILVKVVVAVLDRWVLWLLPDWGRISLYGSLELTNGCLALTDLPPELRLIPAAGFVSFGGICVMLQTAAVAEGISLGLYFPGKLFQSAVSMLAASFLCPGAVSPAFQAVLAAGAVSLGWILRKTEKRCGNQRRVIV